MAVDRTEYSDKDIAIRKIMAQMHELSESRRLEEEAINVEFRVDECNRAKQTLIETYQPQLEALQAQLRTLQGEMNDIVLEK